MSRLVLPHNRPDLARLAGWLDEQERALAMPDRVAYAVRLCLEEAVGNLIRHVPAQSGIVVDLEWQGDVMVAAIEDHGPPFDPRTAPVPARPASLEDALPGGLGIMLMRSFASGIDYDTAAGRNRLTFRFDRRVATEPVS